eukprot:1433999-Pyramimonas_sp.AAC.1
MLHKLLQAAGNEDAEYVGDLLAGFPLTETLHVGNLGVPVPGGLRRRGRPGLGGPEPLAGLKE